MVWLRPIKKFPLGFGIPLEKQTFSGAAVHPAIIDSWEENVTLQCSLVLAIININIAICKSGVISNDQQSKILLHFDTYVNNIIYATPILILRNQCFKNRHI